jgi:acetylornithine/N-succinyldiaminopimelate aminotransferase
MTVLSDPLFGVYNRAPLRVDHGKGAWLYDQDGVAYLDCVQGVATNGLGHAHPALVEALCDQAQKLWHVSNIFTIPAQEDLARALTQKSFADKVFFANSGAEAVECALKLVRKYHDAKGASERVDVITFEGAFHGRTYASVNAGGNETYLKGFGPRLPGFVALPFGDHEALTKAAASPTAAAIMLEPVQGEGGARALPIECLKGVRALCDQYGLLMVLDEIQIGMGRSGKLWAYEYAQIEPDIMTIAKALGGGFPVGACLARAEVADTMIVGSHGSTFGGNPLAMAVAAKAFELVSSPEILDNVLKVSNFLRQQLAGLLEAYPDMIEEIRGKGLLIGLKVKPNNRDVMKAARENNLLIGGGSDNCVRLLPPLNLTQDEASEVISRLDSTFLSLRKSAKT